MRDDAVVAPASSGSSHSGVIISMAETVVAQPVTLVDHKNNTGRRIRGQRRQYTCAYCAKVFKRSEHCVRHERTHTNEKPFQCRYCDRAYSRKDLVTRHERTLHAPGQDQQSALAVAPLPADVEGGSPDDASESGATSSPASTMVRCGTTTVDLGSSTANPAHIVSPAAELGQNQPTVTTPGAPTTNTTTQQPDFYMGLQDGVFDMYAGSTEMHMDIDMDHHHEQLGSIQHDGFVQSQPQQHQQHQQQQQQQEQQQPQQPRRQTISQPDMGPPQQQHQQPEQNHQITPFQQHGTGAVPTFESEMSFFAFSPLPAGLFDNMMDYPSLLQPTPMSMSHPDAAMSSIPAAATHPTAYSPQQLSPDQDLSVSGRSGTSAGRDNGDLPLLVKDKPPLIPNFVADEGLHASVCADMARRLGGGLNIAKDIPSPKLMQGFLASFFKCYYRHHPFIHLATLSTVDTPGPLILAMCCIGALYRLDRRRAQRWYAIGTEAIAGEVRRFVTKSSSEKCPLWVAQTKLLLTAYGALSGDKDMATSVMDENGFYTLLYTKVRLDLAAENSDMNKMTWESWVQRESWKRLLAGVYVASTIHVIIWDANPQLNTCRDLEMEVLHDESFWNAKTAAEWSELRAKQPQQDYRTMRDALASILSDNSKPGCSPRPGAGTGFPRLSPLTALFLMHAAVVHTWQLVQVAQALSPAASLSSLSSLGHDPVSSLLMSTAVRSLARCHELLVIAQSENAGEPGYEEGTSQIFNCQATLRMAYIRLFSSPSNGCFNRPSLISLDDPAAINSFVSTFAITKQERSPHLLDAVVKAFDGLRIPVRMGHMLVRKTAALRWSPAHAIAGWDCALFVCKWVHSVEMDRLNDMEPSPAEAELLALITDVLEEAEYDTGTSKSLAAGVARTWSYLLQDVWVWSITPRMGAVLEQMAIAFERVNDAHQRSKV